MTSYIDLLAAHDKLQVELDFARHERNIMAREVKKAQQQVEMLKASFWIAHRGFHLGDPCMFCGVAYDEVLPGECDGHLVQLDAAPFMYKRME